MAQSLPHTHVVLNSERQRSHEDVCSQAANAAITAMSVKLCSGMDSMSVAVKLHAKHLLSDNTLEAVRDFQEVKEARNSRILENVKSAITVIGLQGFEDFLSVLREFPLLCLVVCDLQESYRQHWWAIQAQKEQDRRFWERQRAQMGTPPVPSLTCQSSITQHSPSLPHSLGGEEQRHYPACPTPCTDSSYSVTAHTPFDHLQSMPTNQHFDLITNSLPQHKQSKLLRLMPKPPPGADSESAASSYSLRPLPSNSASLCLNPEQPSLGPRRMPYGTREAHTSCWPMESSHRARYSHQPIPSQSSPPAMQSANGPQSSVVSGLALEQMASSPAPSSTGTNQFAFPHAPWQHHNFWLHSGSGSHSPADSGLLSLQGSHSTSGYSMDSIVEQLSSDTEGFLLPPKPAMPTHMCEVLPSGSSSSTGGNSAEKVGNSKKLHRQKSFDQGIVLKQGSHPDSMDSGITGSQASLDNEDDAHVV